MVGVNCSYNQLYINAEKNILYVGFKQTLMSEELVLNNVHWSYPQTKKEFEALVKIRYNMKSVPAKIIYNDKLKGIPKILETPYTSISGERIYPPYKHEIEMIKNKTFNEHLIEDIENYYK